mmetsp:Transcript_18726/g.21476  ORF Transcript_18726/g.21476 Transcript_18726/m.21476 type:complete len:127 (-) Transcript_18726:14-394(-)
MPHSPLESCGFILHILTLPLILIYSLSIIIPEHTLFEWGVTYNPTNFLSIYVPTSILCIFISILFINGAMNGLSVPKLESTDTMWDNYSGSARLTSHANSSDALPDIGDIDVGAINDLFDQSLQRK